MRKSVENLATSKITGGRRHPARIRRKYEIDRYPNEPVTGFKLQLQDESEETTIKQH